jgi:uncharacterized protein
VPIDRVKPPLYFYRDSDKNEIDLLIEDGDTLYPIEIKTSSDPTKSMVKAFRYLSANKTKQVGVGAVICLTRERLPLTEGVWMLPVWMI